MRRPGIQQLPRHRPTSLGQLLRLVASFFSHHYSPVQRRVFSISQDLIALQLPATSKSTLARPVSVPIKSAKQHVNKEQVITIDSYTHIKYADRTGTSAVGVNSHTISASHDRWSKQAATPEIAAPTAQRLNRNIAAATTASHTMSATAIKAAVSTSIVVPA